MVQFLKRIFYFVFVVIGLYLFSAFVLSIIPTQPQTYQSPKSHTIYLITNGIHLDFVIEKKDLPTDFLEKLNRFQSAKHIAFGWGDKGFYLDTPTWNELKTSTVLNALFLKGESAMHVTEYHHTYSEFIKIEICKEQMDALFHFIESSFVINDVGKFKEIDRPGYSKDDKFYEAKGSYTAINTCNSWINQGLKKAAIKTSIWTPFDKGILYHIEE